MSDSSDRRADQFEAAWKAGQPPRIEDYLDIESAQEGTSGLRELLINLVGIDLEYRWRSAAEGVVVEEKQGEATAGLPARPRLGDYVGRYACLGPLDQLPTELAAQEYYVRHRWGDRPGHDEYLSGFGRQDPALKEMLLRVDRELFEERTAPFDGRAGSAPAGSRIGPYKVLRRLGEGGFSIVYLAEQERPVKRRVALKILKPGMDTKEVLARFESERQALAIMDHPNIAKVFDAGTTETGHPYFVMEAIQGEPITDYCDRHRLTVDQRMKIFIPICQAVQHAHHKGLIHRDLKPSNVLVAIRDDQPVPKIIDFGVAKAMAQPLTERTLFTEQGQLIGTPEYMSPEQAEMSNVDIDTRSDVYSLGVLLYELLAGALPFDHKTLRRAGYDEIRRIIREVDPPKPSTKLSTLGKESESIAQSRRSDASMLQRRLRGELDWIVMKALEKDRTRRYATAVGLAEDIQRYLKHEPVEAGPPGVMYRLRKLVRKYRTPLGATAAMLIVLTGLVAFAVTAETRARWATAREKKEAAERLKGDAREFLKAGSFQEAEEAFAKALGVDPTDTQAREEMTLAAKEREIASVSQSVREHVAHSRFDQALGMAEAVQVKYPKETRIRDLVHLAKGTSTLHVKFDLGKATKAWLQSISDNGAQSKVAVLIEKLLSSDGMDIQPGWHALTIEYSPGSRDAGNEPNAVTKYILLVDRSVPYYLHARQVVVGQVSAADYSGFDEAVRDAKPGYVLALAPGEHDFRGGVLSTPNVRVRSLLPTKRATVRVGRHKGHSVVLNAWDIVFSELVFEGRNPELSWPGDITFKQCAFCKVDSCKLIETSIEAQGCDGLAVISNLFTSHESQWIHHRADIADSRRVVFRGNTVDRTNGAGWRTLIFRNSDGILALDNQIGPSAYTGLVFQNCRNVLIAGNSIQGQFMGNVCTMGSPKTILAFNEIHSAGQYNIATHAGVDEMILYNVLRGASSGIQHYGSSNCRLEGNLISDSSDVGILLSGTDEDHISENIFMGNRRIISCQNIFWGRPQFRDNLMDRELTSGRLAREGNVVCRFSLGEPTGLNGRYLLRIESGDAAVDEKSHSFGPALALKGEFLAIWTAVADALANSECLDDASVFGGAWPASLTRESRRLHRGLAGSFDSLNKTGNELNVARRRAAKLELEFSFGDVARANRGTGTSELTDAVAETILKLEKDDVADAGRTADRHILWQRVSGLGRANLEEQRKTVADLKAYVSAKAREGLTYDDLALVISAARALEYYNRHEMAADVFSTFAKLLAQSKNAHLSQWSKMMDGAARRLKLVGKKMEVWGTKTDGTELDWHAYRGKAVLVHFGASSSLPCRLELPNLRMNYELYRERGFDVVGINTGYSVRDLEEFLGTERLPWVTLHEKGALGKHPLATYYGVISIPTSILVDKNGEVVSLNACGEELGTLLEKLLGPPYRPEGRLVYVDLQPKANARLAEGFHDSSEDNNLADLPKGEQTLAGVKFTIGEHLIQLAGKFFPGGPEKVEGIPVNRAFVRLYILHSTAWGHEQAVTDGMAIGQYKVHYEDKAVATIPVVYGEDVRDWYDLDHSKPVLRGRVAWVGTNARSRRSSETIRLYLSVWENPQPDKKIVSIDYVTRGTCAAPFCVAMTVEEATASASRE